MNNEKVIWDYLRVKGLTPIAVAGVMGNLYAESGLVPNNLQQTYNASLGMSDAQYTAVVDNGTYTNFVRDQAGYGLAQWTYWSRKEGLLNLAKSRGKSIADLYVQLDFLCNELQEFGLFGKLNASKTVRDASNIMLLDFEKPFDTGVQVQNARAKYSQDYYDRLHAEPIAMVQSPAPAPTPAAGIGYSVIGMGQFSDKAAAMTTAQYLKDLGLIAFVSKIES